MKALSELGTRDLVWQYPQTREGVFELTVDGNPIGQLHFDERPGANSVGELDGQRWIFQHTNDALPRVTVSTENRADAVAEFVPWLLGGGTVSFAGGPVYCWNRARIWSQTWCFRRQGQGSSICVSQQSGPLRDGGRVKVCGNAAGQPEAPVLVLLAWYLRVLAFEMLTEYIPAVG